MTDTFIGFPPPLLGSKPLRLPILLKGEGFFVLEQPVGVMAQRHPWFPHNPNLQDAIIYQLENGKEELAPLGIESLGAITTNDPHTSGMVLFATNRETGNTLKDAVGSDFFTFTFSLLTLNNQLDDLVVCDLPIYQSDRSKSVKISHSLGKKSFTSFKRIERLGRYELWEASTTFPRLFQIRLHAQEIGLRIVGETVFDRVSPIYLSSLKRNYRPKGDDEQPLYKNLCLHLRKMTFTLPNEETTEVFCNIPKQFGVLLKRLRPRALS